MHLQGGILWTFLTIVPDSGLYREYKGRGGCNPFEVTVCLLLKLLKSYA